MQRGALAAGWRGVRVGEGRGSLLGLQKHPLASQRSHGGCGASGLLPKRNAAGGHVQGAEACKVHPASRQRQVCLGLPKAPGPLMRPLAWPGAPCGRSYKFRGE